MRAASENSCDLIILRARGAAGLAFCSRGLGWSMPRGRPLTRQLEMKFTPLGLDLHQQAFAQAASGHAHRIQVLHQLHRRGQKFGSGLGPGSRAAGSYSRTKPANNSSSPANR